MRRFQCRKSISPCYKGGNAQGYKAAERNIFQTNLILWKMKCEEVELKMLDYLESNLEPGTQGDRKAY